MAEPRTVGDAMLRRPKVCRPDTTMADVRALFEDDHVHSVLVADGETLLTVLDRADVDGARPDAPAQERGRLTGRTVGPDADLDETWRRMEAEPRRRLAVVDERNALVGLLCLKRRGHGFCSDDDVASRAAELGWALPPRLRRHLLPG